jgi:tripartite-type tricarboxylate transporter receptor subunit TctC
LGAEVVAALAEPAVVSRIRQMGAEPAPLGPQAYAAFMRAELARWAPIVKASGAVAD